MREEKEMNFFEIINEELQKIIKRSGILRLLQSSGHLIVQVDEKKETITSTLSWEGFHQIHVYHYDKNEDSLYFNLEELGYGSTQKHSLYSVVEYVPQFEKCFEGNVKLALRMINSKLLQRENKEEKEDYKCAVCGNPLEEIMDNKNLLIPFYEDRYGITPLEIGNKLIAIWGSEEENEIMLSKFEFDPETGDIQGREMVAFPLEEIELLKVHLEEYTKSAS